MLNNAMTFICTNALIFQSVRVTLVDFWLDHKKKVIRSYKILSGNLIEVPAILISMLLLHIHDTYVARIHLDVQQE